MEREESVLSNVVNYSKWKIFGVTCRFFGVKHFSKHDDPLENLEKFKKCSIDNDPYPLINFIIDKANLNKENNEGVLDVYSENSYSNLGIEQAIRDNENYYMQDYDILNQIRNNFFNCLYLNKQDENFKNECLFYLKNDGRNINTRFHYIDLRERRAEFPDATIFEYGKIFKKLDNSTNLYYTTTLYNIFAGAYRFLQTFFSGELAHENIILEGFIEGSFEYKFVKNYFVYNRKNSKWGENYHKGYKQLLSLKNVFYNGRKLNLFEDIKNYFINFLLEGIDKINIISNSLEKNQEIDGRLLYNFDKYISFVVTLEMDIYFFGRFFKNILVNKDKSGNVIVVAGRRHIDYYIDFLKTYNIMYGFNAIFNFGADYNDNCVKTRN